MTERKKNWKLKLQEARLLSKKSVEMLHARVSLLVEIEADSEFQDWCVENHVNSYNQLDEEVADTAFDYLTLKTVLAEYPTCEEWVKTSVRVMVAAIAKKHKKEGGKGISYKQKWQAAMREIDRLNATIEQMKLQMQQMESDKRLFAGSK